MKTKISGGMAPNMGHTVTPFDPFFFFFFLPVVLFLFHGLG